MAFKRAIVTAVGPLRILIDGDTVAVPFTPKSLIDPATLAVDDVVHADQSGHRLVVLGRVGGLVLSDASTSVKGIVELATDAETITGTDAGRAVTPAALAAALADPDVRAALGIPFAMAAGEIDATTSWQTVTWPSGRFSVPPIVTCQMYSGSGSAPGQSAMITSITATSCIMRNSGISAIQHWHAMQMTSGSASG